MFVFNMHTFNFKFT